MIELKNAYLVSGNTIGNKSKNLSILLSQNFDVKPGFIITTSEINSYSINLELLSDNTQYAVRSSAVGEDGEDYSWAGQFLSILSVYKDDVPNAVRELIEHYEANRINNIYGNYNDVDYPDLAILIQEMVIPQYSGVIFTKNPLNGENEIIIEIVVGYGDSLVSGRKTPNSYTFNMDGNLKVKNETSFYLEDRILIDLFEISKSIKVAFNDDQDIEFAIEVDSNKVFINQSRAITSKSNENATTQGSFGDTYLKGIGASNGIIKGKVVVLNSVDDINASKIVKGSILVTKFTDPSYTPLLIRLANNGGLVTEIGGLLSHAAIVARELNIACIVNVPGVTERLTTGQIILIDGSKGIIIV